MKLNFVSRCIRKAILHFIPEVVEVSKNACFAEDHLWNVELGHSVKLYSPHQISDTKIGDYTYIAQNSHVDFTTIGKCCSIGPNLLCGWGVHPVEALSTAPMFYSTKRQNGMSLSSTDKIVEKKQIVIGNDVCIGANVTILDGVTIGDGAYIGAGAVVSKDIPPFAVAVGCPIRIIRYRFAEDQREKLLRIKWWDFDEEKLKDVEKLLFDVDGFIEKWNENDDQDA